MRYLFHNQLSEHAVLPVHAYAAIVFKGASLACDELNICGIPCAYVLRRCIELINHPVVEPFSAYEVDPHPVSILDAQLRRFNAIHDEFERHSCKIECLCWL